ncbi:MAG: cysteine desulfurase family protein [Clostridiales bacterium]|nr:cysteine desulfurase family protein [Clostridiales bacterium]
MIYLDNAATTKPSEAAFKAAAQAVECFANPSSLYGPGLEAQKLIEKSKGIIASKLGIDRKNIFFTSGGTEANNTAIFGAAYAKRRLGNRVITTKVEHPSVLEAFKKLGEEGFEVVYVGVDENGIVNMDELEAALNEDTILVSVMHVNNETGMIMPVERIKPMQEKLAPKAMLHCDCVQSFGKLPVLPKKWGADMVSISAHKIRGFKGCGALYVRDAKIRPLIFGGEQQQGLRPGTENVAGILAFGAAAQECDCDNSRLLKFRAEFEDEIKKNIDNVIINGTAKNNSGSVINISFLGIKAEILLHALEKHEIYVSTGSACSSHKPQPSHVLTAMGKSREEIAGAVRMSFIEPLEREELIYTVEAIKKEVNTIRRYMR